MAGCAFFVVKFENGVMTPVSKKIMSSAFVAECTVELTVKNGRLLASASDAYACQDCSTPGHRSPRRMADHGPACGRMRRTMTFPTVRSRSRASAIPSLRWPTSFPRA